MLDYEELEAKKAKWRKIIAEMTDKIDKCLKETEKILTEKTEKNTKNT